LDALLQENQSKFDVHEWHTDYIANRLLIVIQSSVSDDGSIVYSEEKLLRLGALLGTVLASTMPVVAIVVLSFVTRMKMRLAVIALFTALFSTLLGLFSNGKAVEIFTATSG
jgi:cell division protein FtsX